MAQKFKWKTQKYRIDRKLRSLNLAGQSSDVAKCLNTTRLQRHTVEEYPHESASINFQATTWLLIVVTASIINYLYKITQKL